MKQTSGTEIKKHRKQIPTENLEPIQPKLYTRNKGYASEGTKLQIQIHICHKETGKTRSKFKQTQTIKKLIQSLFKIQTFEYFQPNFNGERGNN